ncbi:hypothetical protein DL546_001208 [Coniochaeta pulveracea]|uniref:SGNH hydrolase-type esterase domain-containing protein n=1 Tax=Coniochaeta pulveracea TaxID=177199 RepID=A0A420Y2R6_9PEZI|nr:hypothetical protein DL546_001208 [Coniochaeta pulveracea]
MMLLSIFLVGAVAAKNCQAKKDFDNLVTFGDSYTDNGRLNYYSNHDGQGPPPGVYQDVQNVTASGGRTWPQYVQDLTGATLRDYAVSGATCSNLIVDREAAWIHRDFPSVLEDEIPGFKADVAFKTLYPNRTAKNTVYALWIGTNDVGYGGFLSDSEAPGSTLTTYVDCVWTVFDNIYQTGGRRFVLLNLAPLDLSPLYSPQSEGGIGDSQYWGNKTAYNETEYQQKMKQYTTTLNTVFDYGVPFQTTVKNRWPQASVTIFNVHQLLTDIHNNPGKYLAAPASTSYYHQVNPVTGASSNLPGSLDQYMWYDELHPSNKTDSVIAKEFVDVVAGTSPYATQYGAKNF